MNKVFLLDQSADFVITGKVLSTVEDDLLKSLVLPLACNIDIGLRSWGNSYEAPFIVVTASAFALRQLAFILLRASLGSTDEICLPISEKTPTQGMVVSVARPPSYPDSNVYKFNYRRSENIKRYPWYPQSEKWNALTELPTIGLCPFPGEIANLTKKNFLDLDRPHALFIGGCPGGVLRLARLLLNYANMSEPIELIDLEIEGGFRGLAPFSYCTRFIRID